MKKLLFFVAALFVTSFAQAQEGIKLGLKAGANLSSITGDLTGGMKNTFGFHAGAFVDYGISDMISVRPELLYSMKGAKGGSGDEESTLTLHYLDIPVLAHINAGGLFFELGPTLGFKLASSTDDDEDDEDDEDGFSTVDFGYAAGIGYQLESGLGIGLRYQGGLSNIIDADTPLKWRNSVFQLSLSYTLGSR